MTRQDDVSRRDTWLGHHRGGWVGAFLSVAPSSLPMLHTRQESREPPGEGALLQVPLLLQRVLP